MLRTVEEIKQNLVLVINKMKAAAERVERNYEEIKLVVVTKSQSIDTTRNAIAAGARIIGENYVEEGVTKKNLLEQFHGTEWHMIGHIQSRKTQAVTLNFDMVHSLDSLKLAMKLDHQSMLQGRKLPVLLEFNIGGEDNKYGWKVSNENDWVDLIPTIREICNLKYLKISGLMAMPPYAKEPEHSRMYCKKLVKLQNFLKDQIPIVEWSELSIGTSYDFEVAIEEGATMVRIGDAILGRRE